MSGKLAVRFMQCAGGFPVKRSSMLTKGLHAQENNTGVRKNIKTDGGGDFWTAQKTMINGLLVVSVSATLPWR